MHHSSQRHAEAAAACCENDCLTHVHAEGCVGPPAVRVQYTHAHAGLDGVTLQHTNERGFMNASLNDRHILLVSATDVWKDARKP